MATRKRTLEPPEISTKQAKISDVMAVGANKGVPQAKVNTLHFSYSGSYRPQTFTEHVKYSSNYSLQTLNYKMLTTVSSF